MMWINKYHLIKTNWGLGPVGPSGSRAEPWLPEANELGSAGVF